MRIGEFARVTGIPISVLRHYDKEGLLPPDYIDNLTGYRYYSAEQIESVRRISLLKQVGLSLKEIREILKHPGEAELVRETMERHEQNYRTMLANLKEAKRIMLDGKEKLSELLADTRGITEEQDGEEILLKSAPLPLPLNPGEFKDACRLLEEEAGKRDYQRISGFMTYGNEENSAAQAVIRTIRLKKEQIFLQEDIHMPFEDDERVIGRWRAIREYAVKEDFYAEITEGWETYDGNKDREIFFLPGGERYWVYGWTRGYLLLDGGSESCACRYEIEDYDGKRYMFVESKGYEYHRGGKPRIVVLEQMDHRQYTKREIAREDDLDMPFVPDERVLGVWKAYDFIERKEDFEAGKKHLTGELFYKEMRFGENGEFTSLYGQEIIGSDRQRWTKGYVLKAYNRTACAYEIVNADGTDYMIIEWKSGDYRWGGYDTDYYVFVREG